MVMPHRLIQHALLVPPVPAALVKVFKLCGSCLTVRRKKVALLQVLL
jgi:hypothetical protein